MAATKKKKAATSSARRAPAKPKKAKVIVLPAHKCDQPVPEGTVVIRRFPSTTGRAGRPKTPASVLGCY
jgi:hypothetical protein